MNEEDTQAMLAILRDMAESLREIARVQGVASAGQNFMAVRGIAENPYVPGGLMLKQDGNNLQVDLPVPSQLSAE